MVYMYTHILTRPRKPQPVLIYGIGSAVAEWTIQLHCLLPTAVSGTHYVILLLEYMYTESHKNVPTLGELWFRQAQTSDLHLGTGYKYSYLLITY